MLGSIFLVLSHNQTVVMLFIVCLGFRWENILVWMIYRSLFYFFIFFMCTCVLWLMLILNKSFRWQRSYWKWLITTCLWTTRQQVLPLQDPRVPLHWEFYGRGQTWISVCIFGFLKIPYVFICCLIAWILSNTRAVFNLFIFLMGIKSALFCQLYY